ncbi:hypothetical protein GCM10009767_11720 [Kocuria aegyptia]|uniref:Uncharacterized protein n=1 Tax=Kocuria aegyptia TaxID=330943 RepID=A0ABP4WKS1_9MICC
MAEASCCTEYSRPGSISPAVIARRTAAITCTASELPVVAVTDGNEGAAAPGRLSAGDPATERGGAVTG